MKKTTFAAAVGLGVILGIAQGLSAERNRDRLIETSPILDSQCDSILGSKDRQPPVHIRYCENRQ
jgi:hypothetical protein